MSTKEKNIVWDWWDWIKFTFVLWLIFFVIGYKTIYQQYFGPSVFEKWFEEQPITIKSGNTNMKNIKEVLKAEDIEVLKKSEFTLSCKFSEYEKKDFLYLFGTKRDSIFLIQFEKFDKKWADNYKILDTIVLPNYFAFDSKFTLDQETRKVYNLDTHTDENCLTYEIKYFIALKTKDNLGKIFLSTFNSIERKEKKMPLLKIKENVVEYSGKFNSRNIIEGSFNNNDYSVYEDLIKECKYVPK